MPRTRVGKSSSRRSGTDHQTKSDLIGLDPKRELGVDVIPLRGLGVNLDAFHDGTTDHAYVIIRSEVGFDLECPQGVVVFSEDRNARIGGMKVVGHGVRLRGSGEDG